MFRLLGRDPIKQPLDRLELALFEQCLFDAVTDEFAPRGDRALVTGNPNAPGD